MGIEVMWVITGSTHSIHRCLGRFFNTPIATAAWRITGSLLKRLRAWDARWRWQTDLLALVCPAPPGEWGADIALAVPTVWYTHVFRGSSAAFFVTKEEYKRQVPGRIIGISKDAYGKRR